MNAVRIVETVCNAGSFITKIVLNILNLEYVRGNPMADVTINENQSQVSFDINARNSGNGNLLTLPFEVELDTPDIVAVDTNSETMSGTVVRHNQEVSGTVTMTVTVTNPDGTTVSATATISVVTSVTPPVENADTVTITFGTPE